MRVKFCGMTNYEDVRAAIQLGVDFVGFVFYRKSRRFIDFEIAREIVKKVKGEVKTVGVFVDNSADFILDATNFVGLDYVQIYHNMEIKNSIRVYRIKDSLPDVVKEEGFILFDTYTDSIGGAGKSFNHDLLRGVSYEDRLFVAGGINVENVERIARVGVFGVDLVSSIEKSPGKKDFYKMKEFMEVVGSLK